MPTCYENILGKTTEKTWENS